MARRRTFTTKTSAPSAWHQRIFEDAAVFKGRLAEDKSRNFIFAAHVATQYLLAAGLPSEKFAAVLDNNQDKIGKRLYGHDLFVRAPAAIKNIDGRRCS